MTNLKVVTRAAATELYSIQQLQRETNSMTYAHLLSNSLWTSIFSDKV